MKKWSAHLLAFSCLLLWASHSWAENLRTLTKRVRLLTGDTPYYTTIPRLSDASIKDLLNEGQSYFSAQWVLVQRTTFTLVAGTTEYAMPTDYMAVKRVQFKNSIIPEATLNGLDGDGRSWVTSGGTPNTYYTRTTTISVIGFTPWPTSVGTGTATMDYYVQAAELSGPNDIPFNGLPDFYPLHESLSKYAAYRFFLTIGNMNTANIYAQEVLSDIKRLRDMVDTKPNYRPGASPLERR